MPCRILTSSALLTFSRRHGIDAICWAILIGLIGGLSSAAYREANIWLTHSLTRTCGDIVAIAESLDGFDRLLIPTLGGFFAGILLTIARRYPGGKTGQDYLEAIRTNDGALPFRATLIRLASSLFSVSSGSSIGREGGMVQLSAMLVSVLGQKGRMAPERLRLWWAAAARQDWLPPTTRPWLAPFLSRKSSQDPLP